MPKKTTRTTSKSSKAGSVLSRNRPNKSKATFCFSDTSDEDDVVVVGDSRGMPSTESDTTCSVGERDSKRPKNVKRKPPKTTKKLQETEKSQPVDDSTESDVFSPPAPIKTRAKKVTKKAVKENPILNEIREASTSSQRELRSTFSKQNNKDRTTSTSSSTTTANKSNSLDDVQASFGITDVRRETDERFESFAELLSKVHDYPTNLTKEVETDGKVTTFVTKTPEFQRIEQNCVHRLCYDKNNTEIECQRFCSAIEMIQSGQPNDLMDMSLETVIKLLERVRGSPIESFGDIMECMAHVQGSNIAKIINEENSKQDEAGMISEEDEYGYPKINYVTPAVSKVLKPAIGGATAEMKKPNYVFPSSSEMAKAKPVEKFCTPASSNVYHFIGNTGLSTNKAPRHFKPGEMVFSQSGSPLLLPKIGLDKKAERIAVNDPDGHKIVEVVMYQGEQDKTKEFKDFVTDVRGLAATKSIKKTDRIRPPRLPRGPPPSSASKKPVWH